jgi:membrane protease YdiL (CAAX protease family)
MNLTPLWNPEYSQVVTSLLTFYISYLIYHFAADANNFSRLIGNRLPARRRSILSIVLQRVAGFFLLGVIPALAVIFIFPGSIMDYGFSAAGSLTPFPFYSLIFILFPPLIFWASRSPKMHHQYLVIQVEIWDLPVIIINTGSWFLYLLAYEFCFRGFLLFSIARLFGPIPAIIVTTLLYSLVHLTKGPGETVGALLFGCLYGWITLETGTLWAAFLGHLTLAVCNDIFCIYHRKDRSFSFR